MAYAAASDLVKRFDERDIADLASDDGTPVADLATDAKVTAALSSASGRINSAVMVADLYQAADLSGLSGDDAEFLKDITCALAMGFLLRRRSSRYQEIYAAVVKQAEEQLELLRSGKNLFNVAEVKSAGQPSVDGPTAAEYALQNGISDRTRNYYPARATRLPTNRR